MSKANPRSKNGHRRRQLIARVRAMREPCWICCLPIGAGHGAGSPYALEVDELIPVSKGGSPIDPDNARAAHRCCNNWRSNRPVSFVESIRARVFASKPDIRDPQVFVACAKQIESKGDVTAPFTPPETTTDW